MENFNQHTTDLGIWLAKEARTGKRERIEFGSIQKAFPDRAKEELKESCYDLEAAGIVEVDNQLDTVKINYELYWRFDKQTLNVDVSADAVNLAERILQDQSLANIYKLHENVAWEYRRFNPAVAMIADFLPDRHLSREICAEYPVRSIVLLDKGAYELKKFVGTFSG